MAAPALLTPPLRSATPLALCAPYATACPADSVMVCSIGAHARIQTREPLRYRSDARPIRAASGNRLSQSDRPNTDRHAHAAIHTRTDTHVRAHIRAHLPINATFDLYSAIGMAWYGYRRMTRRKLKNKQNILAFLFSKNALHFNEKEKTKNDDSFLKGCANKHISFLTHS